MNKAEIQIVEERKKVLISFLKQFNLTIVINFLYDQEIENMDMSEYDYDHDEYHRWR